MSLRAFSSPPIEGRGGILGVNVLMRPDGRTIHLDDIATNDQGRELLVELDDAIGHIEDQLARAEMRGCDPEWRIRATTALKRKRRIRPALQERIGVLRRQERTVNALRYPTAPIENRRRAFIKAAAAELPVETLNAIWRRAQADHPEAFTDHLFEPQEA